MSGDNQWPTGSIVFHVLACVSAGQVVIDNSSEVIHPSLSAWTETGTVGGLLVEGFEEAELLFNETTLAIWADQSVSVSAGDEVLMSWLGAEDSVLTVPVTSLGRVFDQHALPASNVPSSYPLRYAPVAASIVVTIDGMVSASGWSHDATDNTINFSILPPGGSIVELSYAVPGGCQ